MDSTIEKWIKANEHCDYATLLLKAGSDTAKKDAALQLWGRKKAAAKLPDILGCSDFRFPTLLSAEQCTSEALARYHAALIEPQGKVLDMTAGLGIDSIMLAHKARSVTSIELNPVVADTLRHNLAALGITNVEVVNADSMTWLQNHPADFDTIYIDPYRRDDCMNRVYRLEDSEPDIVASLNLLLSHCSTLIIKASPMLDISATTAVLAGHARQVIAVGTIHECKELIIIADKHTHPTPLLSAATIESSGQSIVIESATDTPPQPAISAEPTEGRYLYEPYPAVMKSGLYNQFPQLYCMAPICANTHLYLHSERVAPVAAATYIIEEVFDFDKRACRTIAARYSHLNVAVRNFPLKAPQLEKRLGIKPGGDHKLYGVTTAKGEYKLLITSQIVEP